MKGDKLWTIHEVVYVVAPNRDEAAAYLYGAGHVIDHDEGCWPGMETQADGGLGDYLTLESPDTEVSFEGSDGKLYLMTALRCAEERATGTILGLDDDD